MHPCLPRNTEWHLFHGRGHLLSRKEWNKQMKPRAPAQTQSPKGCVSEMDSAPSKWAAVPAREIRGVCNQGESSKMSSHQVHWLGKWGKFRVRCTHSRGNAYHGKWEVERASANATMITCFGVNFLYLSLF